MAKRNVVNFRIVNIPDDDAFKQLKKQGKVDPNAMYVSPDTSLKEKHITNCITEIPQDIKLELNNGTLTLKAGSKLYVPNGSGTFDTLTLTADKTATQTANDTRMYFYNGSYIEKFPIAQCFSGSSAPSGYTYMFWYDTANNVVKKTSNSGSTWESGWSLPFAICTSTNGAISSIDQVFNGFGYIGSTVFALPGVKGLIPDGRNADGTLKNRNMTIQSVLTKAIPSNTGWHYITINATGTNVDFATNYYTGTDLPSGATSYSRFYNTAENLTYNVVSGKLTQTPQFVLGCYIDHSTSSPYKINSMKQATAFHAVDYSDFETLSDTVEINNNNAVHKTGNETIGGQKTFTTGTIWKKEDWDATQNPTSNKFATWSLVNDKNNTMLSYVETSYLTDGTIQQTIGARKEINGTKHTASLSLRIDSSGNKTFALSDNPPSSSNGAQVATTYWANAKFLPLAGGTITGNIVMSGQNGYAFGNGAKIRNSGNANANLTMFLKDGDWKQSYIGLASGEFAIYAGDGTNVAYLVGKIDGTLTWDGKPIVRLVAEQKATADNNYTWYRKYSDGWLEQGGIITKDVIVTLPVPFSDSNYTVACAGEYSFNGDNSVLNITATTIQFQHMINKPHRYYACGYAAS